MGIPHPEAPWNGSPGEPQDISTRLGHREGEAGSPWADFKVQFTSSFPAQRWALRRIITAAVLCLQVCQLVSDTVLGGSRAGLGLSQILPLFTLSLSTAPAKLKSRRRSGSGILVTAAKRGFRAPSRALGHRECCRPVLLLHQLSSDRNDALVASTATKPASAPP